MHITRTIGKINGSDIVEEDDRSVTFAAGARLDGDGANGQFGGDPCYAPTGYTGRTLDVLANAGRPGNWFGVATDTGQLDGTPIVQGSKTRVRELTFRLLRSISRARKSRCRTHPHSSMSIP